jgi:RHS repeat-associated protein
VGPGGDVIGRHLASGGRRYYRKDHLGSIRAVVAGNGTVQETRDYYPFGLMMPGRETTEATGAKEDYTGHELDAETSLHYAGARYYMSALGRWTSVDPILGEFGPKTLLEQSRRLLSASPYDYTFGNPVNLIDPTGRSPEDWFRDRNGEIKYDENVQSQADLGQDQQYLGESVLVETQQGGVQLLTGEGHVVTVFESKQPTGEDAALAASGVSAAAAKSQLTLRSAGEAAEGLAKRNAIAGTVLSAGSFIFSTASGTSESTTYQSVKLTTNLGLAAAGTNPIGAIVGFGLDASGLKDDFVEFITMQILKQKVDRTLEDEPRVER